MTEVAEHRIAARLPRESRRVIIERKALIGGRAPRVLVALVASVVDFRVLHLGSFFLDDFRNIAEARAGLSVHLLSKPVGGTHFQPTTRFLNWLTATPLHTSYTATAIVIAVLHGFGTYWLMRLLDTLWEQRPLHLVIGFLFGTSCVLIGASLWVAAAATSVVAVDFAAGACLAFFRWLSSESRLYYATAVVALVVSVCAWETALATPAIITLIWFGFARDWQPLRRAVSAQLPLYAISLAFVMYVQAQPWHQPLHVPSLSNWLALMLVMVGRELASSVIGTGAPNGAQSTFDWLSAIVVVAALAGGGLWLALRRRFNWFALIVIAVGTALVSLPVAAARDFLGPSVAGTTPRYVTFLPLLLAVAAAGAVRSPRTDRRGDRPWPQLGFFASVAALACVAYFFNLSKTFNSGQVVFQFGRAASAIANRLDVGIVALGRGGESSLVDSTMPFPIWYPAAAPTASPPAAAGDPWAQLSKLAPFWSTRVRTFGEDRIAGLDPSGVIRWASFHPRTAGAQYVRVVVRAPVERTLTVRIAADFPTQPDTPWRISMRPGTHSFTLPAWSIKVRSVAVTGSGFRVLRIQTGTVTLTSPVALQ